MDRQGIGRGGRLESDAEEDDPAIGVLFGDLDGV
jgi:hypothetical protein